MRATIERLQRVSNSESGNPTMRLFTDKGTFLTKVDSHSGIVALGLVAGETVEMTIRDGRVEHIDEV